MCLKGSSVEPGAGIADGSERQLLQKCGNRRTQGEFSVFVWRHSMREPRHAHDAAQSCQTLAGNDPHGLARNMEKPAPSIRRSEHSLCGSVVVDAEGTCRHQIARCWGTAK